MSAILILLSAQSVTPAAALAAYRDRTSVITRCAEPSGDEVLVCARRNADRYRVPLIDYDAGDPRHEGVPDERERLLARTTNCQERSLFQVGCGMAGVTVGTNGAHLGAANMRPIAP